MQACQAKMPDGVYALTQRMGGNVHAFLIDHPTGLLLVDTLFDTDAHRVINKIHEIGKRVEDLQHILLTHAHRSHLGGLAELKKRSNARVYAHQYEADIIEGNRKAQRIALRPMPPLEVYHLQLGLALGLGSHPPVHVDQALKDGDRVGPLEIIHTPGHTPGCLAFHWPEAKVLLTGDVVVTWPELEPGWKAFTLNFRENRESIGRLAELNDVEFLGVGHGPPADDGHAKLRQLLNQAEGAPPEFFAARIVRKLRRG